MKVFCMTMLPVISLVSGCARSNFKDQALAGFTYDDSVYELHTESGKERQAWFDYLTRPKYDLEP